MHRRMAISLAWLPSVRSSSREGGGGLVTGGGAVLIGVEEQAALQHLVGEGPMPGTKCAGLKAACPILAKQIP